MTCEEASAGKSSFIANENGQAYGEITFELSHCNVTGNGEECTQVTEPWVTKKIRFELVLNDEEAARTPGNKVLAEFDPSNGKEWIEFKYQGIKCKLANVIVSNLALGSLWTDPKVGNGKEEEVELGKLPAETTSYLVKYPDEPRSVWLWNGVNWNLFEPTELTSFGERAKLGGTLLFSLASGEKLSLSETGK